MFSKALFKQSMKANWIKWVAVTLATSVMLAIVIIVLGSIDINGIRTSLKQVFQDADQQAYVQENAVDSYDLTLSTYEFEDSLTTNLDSALADGTLESFRTFWGMIDLANAQMIQNMLASQGFLDGMSEEEQLAFCEEFLTVAKQTDVNTDDATQFRDGLQVVFEETYKNLVYTNAYATELEETQDENTALESAQQAEVLAGDVIGEYKRLKSEQPSLLADLKEASKIFVNDMLYYEVFNSYKTEVGEDQAKVYAVAIKVMSNSAISTYEFYQDEGYEKDYSKEQASASITDQIPEDVAEALSELGNMDIYGLIIGSIFYRIAGILLPMVFVIMTANGLLAGQVDSGSMAYVLSTPTKRRTVTVTQMVYLMLSLLAMFAVVTVVSVVSIFIVGGNDFAINFSEILLFNLGAFLTMFAFAGFCFMCSAIFNRTKYSLSIGGGISIFMLVCTILGLFGSQVVPSAMRIDQMNFFNYLSIITLFDTTAILNGAISYLWKFAILFGIGLITFIIGVFCFDKKDLPL